MVLPGSGQNSRRLAWKCMGYGENVVATPTKENTMAKIIKNAPRRPVKAAPVKKAPVTTAKRS